jgi:hypothetical protein
MTTESPVEQRKPLTQEETLALAKEALASLEQAKKHYAQALARSITDDQGRLMVAPFPMLLDTVAEKVRMDAVLFVLEQLGISIALPVTQLMVQLYEKHTAELGKVKIATAVGGALNHRCKQ